MTDGAGVPYQYFHYSPWGESLISQTRTPNSTGFSTPYCFNAKEFDSESGLFYYGARYYHPVVSQWLSVDPLYYHPNQVDKSPYAYTWNNPVNLVDPDGRCPDCPYASTANEGDIANPHGQQEYVFLNGEWIGVGGEIDEVTVTPSGNRADDPSPRASSSGAQSETGVRTLSKHERTMQNPIVKAVHRAHGDFLRGIAQLTTHVTGQLGTGVSAVGYGAAFIPGAQLIAGGLIAIGNTLSTVSSLGAAALDYSEGNNTGAVLNTANALIPGAANKFIDRNVARGIIGTQGGNILKGGNNARSGVADYLINR
ncbi:RHS repeat-associated core domain-containing protein [Schleiferia thermophila]|uniref:RHS repeat-associated protein n=1 Tax=Schleiferia thermophila TaxID=884107 RepID=A0A368ZVT7_9FLAO|nr:RHS repeat-associated core domain-containing protein [Schleiferia thermophila]RCX00418.1 RHS repeat-associated protein [Schleiferia thermophila]